jgi:hypothetical protein
LRPNQSHWKHGGKPSNGHSPIGRTTAALNGFQGNALDGLDAGSHEDLFWFINRPISNRFEGFISCWLKSKVEKGASQLETVLVIEKVHVEMAGK